MLLEVKNLTVRYGAVVALRDVSFRIDQGEIVALIGPNGAGKSTVLKAVSGMLQAVDGIIDKGQILFEGRSIKGFRTDRLVAEGLSVVPEGRRIFTTMTVLENLQMGAFIRNDKAAIKDSIDNVLTFFPPLKERLYQKAGTLSTGEQQMLAIGRALMIKPKLLLADEPSLGLSPNYVDLVFDKLADINKEGTSILLVEQNAFGALEIAHRAYIFGIGEITYRGETKKLLKEQGVLRQLLGGGFTAPG